MNPGISQNVAAQFFVSSPYLVTETTWLVVASHGGMDLENDHNNSLSLKLSSNLELSVKQFNNATLENGNYHEKIASFKY